MLRKTAPAAIGATFMAVSLGFVPAAHATSPRPTQPAQALDCHRQGSDRGCVNNHYVLIEDNETDFHQAYVDYFPRRGESGKLYDGSAIGYNARFVDRNIERYQVCESVPGGGEGNDHCTRQYYY